MIGCIFGMKISGAHMNPAVSFAMCVHGKMEWRKLLPYILAQFLGSFASMAMVFLVFYDAMLAYVARTHQDLYTMTTAGVYATFSQNYESTGLAFFDQTWGTALLVGGIFAISDKHHCDISESAKPFALGGLLMSIGVSAGWNTCYAINPTRDFAPRLFLYLAGWSDVFTDRHGYWWIPVVAPMLGGVLGATFYQLLIAWPNAEMIERRHANSKTASCT